MVAALVAIIGIVQTVLFWVILARALVSWIRVDPYHPVVRLLHDVTEPLLAPIRRLMPSTGMFDFSPLVLLLVIQVGGELLKTLIVSLF